MIIEHTPWVGKEYHNGLAGSRIAIVGHSHHGDEEDEVLATQDCVAKVMSGQYKIMFFNQVRNYFGFDHHSDFWPRVLFFNYVPNLIGTSDHRYGRMHDAEQKAVAKSRFLRTLSDNRPDKVFVFSKAIAGEIPLPSPIIRTFDGLGVGETEFEIEGNTISQVFMLRHPQFAPKAKMTSAVATLLHGH